MKNKETYVVIQVEKFRQYFQKHMPHSASSKKFCKPFFSNKTSNFDDKIILVEK